MLRAVQKWGDGEQMRLVLCEGRGSVAVEVPRLKGSQKQVGS